MASFHDLETEVPDLAATTRAVLSSTTNGVLGTIRRDGSPRLSGIDSFFHDRDLYIGSMPGARKGQDLRRDPRVALHSIPWESRRLREGAADPGGADVKVAGRVALVTDAGVIASVRQWLGAEKGFEPPDASDLFAIDIDSLAVVSVVDDQLVVDRWSASDGRHTVRRT